MQPSRFPERSSIAGRMSGFMAHLRHNGIPAGLAETENALVAMERIDPLNPGELRLALMAICANDAERHGKFTDLFNAYWFNKGLVRLRQPSDKMDEIRRKTVTTTRMAESETDQGASGRPDAPDDESAQTTDAGGKGRLVAARLVNLRKTDLRQLVSADDLKQAETVAHDIARAMRDRRSRRRRASARGQSFDLRRIARASIAHGGEPLELYRKRRPDRPVRLSVILDVSGSMVIYASVFLAFVRGLASADTKTRAYLLHTHLVPITDALREGDSLKAVGRMSVLANGVGGGTRIGECMNQFARQYAGNAVNGRSVIIILSDGYDTSDPALLASSLARLKRRGAKIVWLNPLKGWRDYAPVARGMAAALPYLDIFAAANTLDSLAALEKHFARL